MKIVGTDHHRPEKIKMEKDRKWNRKEKEVKRKREQIRKKQVRKKMEKDAGSEEDEDEGSDARPEES